MVRAVIRGKVDPFDDYNRVKLVVLGAPGTGGRARGRGSNTWGEFAEFNSEVAAFLDEKLPENVPAP